MDRIGDKIGYARVSTDDQSLELQIKELKNYGCIKIFAEKESGKHTERPELKNLINSVREKDTIVVTRIDRLSRSLREFTNMIHEMDKRNIKFVAIKQKFDTSTAIGEMFLNITASFAQFEGKIISERTKEGMKKAKENGVHCGRPKKMDEKNEKKTREIMERMEAENWSFSETAGFYRIKRSTLYRWIKQIESKQLSN